MNLKNKKGIIEADVACYYYYCFVYWNCCDNYINTVNKSKDNMIYTNSVRIATSIIENIQR